MKWVKILFLLLLFFIPYFLLCYVVFDSMYAILCIISLFIIFIFLLLHGDKIILFMSGCEVASNSQHNEINDLIEYYSFKLNMKKPEIYLIDNCSLNIFSLGINREQSKIVINKNLINLLSKNEIKAILCFGLVFIKNNDVLLKMIGALINSLIYGTFYLSEKLIKYFINRAFFIKDEKRVFLQSTFRFLIVFFILNPLNELIVKFLFSPDRAYINNGLAAELSQDPYSLEMSLRKISNFPKNQFVVDKFIKPLYLVDFKIDEKLSSSIYSNAILLRE